ncbi:hypothetical protein THASP1DRAFT_28950 [Thamnocephalis sphaerospora]|uniref:Uncharacterized protein n=1 Tax=Thamnocephalis sphaerospora TaxID=78915 RepID=A0A4P9XTF4_9FUNG|nr:hypothetical protein THASP1DRAFT_28950 [Thamnocephalis sphaerospora]|eukprot:RKP09272.1 hypothetical protein THASP1DRAFT_28950 [Thamnocephalis sphaerospora]
MSMDPLAQKLSAQLSTSLNEPELLQALEVVGRAFPSEPLAQIEQKLSAHLNASLLDSHREFLADLDAMLARVAQVRDEAHALHGALGQLRQVAEHQASAVTANAATHQPSF